MTDDRLRARVERYFANNPDATVIGALGGLTLSPDHRELVEEIRTEHGDTPVPVSAPETRVVHRNEPYDIYIGRGRGGDGHLNNTEISETGWLGNPYRIGDHGGVHTRDQSLARYSQDVLSRVETDPTFAAALADLKGQRLACYCRQSSESEPDCHGDVLVRIIDALRPANSEGHIAGGEQA